jgi:phospholipid/cholesterol/gamma-HCH transport system substrate-binding protein
VNTERLKLELARARNPFLWLVFVLLAAVVTLVLVFNNLTFVKPFEERYEVDVAFDSVKGVFEGEHPVRIAGVKVGFVSGIRTENGQGIATLNLEPQYGPIYKDARVRIRPQTPLQDMYITIDDRGTEQAGAIPNGSTEPISSEQTQTPVDISRVLDTFDEDTRTHLNVLLDQLTTGLAGNGRDLREAFAQIAPFLAAAEDVTEVMADRQQALRRIITNFADVTDMLAERDEQLNRLITAGNSTLAELASVNGPVAATIGELPRTMTALRTSFAKVRSAENELDPALQRLMPTAREFEDGLEGLREFSNDATPALRDLQPSFRQLEPLSEELRPATDALDKVFDQLETDAPRFDGITQTAALCNDTALSRFFQDSLSVLKFGDSFGAIPRGAISQGSTGFETIPDKGIKPTTPCYEDGGGE